MVWNTDRGKNIQQAPSKQSKNVKKKMVNILTKFRRQFCHFTLFIRVKTFHAFFLEAPKL